MAPTVWQPCSSATASVGNHGCPAAVNVSLGGCLAGYAWPAAAHHRLYPVLPQPGHHFLLGIPHLLGFSYAGKSCISFLRGKERALPRCCPFCTGYCFGACLLWTFGFAIVRCYKMACSIFSPDKGHIHNCQSLPLIW